LFGPCIGFEPHRRRNNGINTVHIAVGKNAVRLVMAAHGRQGASSYKMRSVL